MVCISTHSINNYPQRSCLLEIIFVIVILGHTRLQETKDILLQDRAGCRKGQQSAGISTHH